jgi:hypothetical protein
MILADTSAWGETRSAAPRVPGSSPTPTPTPLQRRAFDLLGVSHRLGVA